MKQIWGKGIGDLVLGMFNLNCLLHMLWSLGVMSKLETDFEDGSIKVVRLS